MSILAIALGASIIIASLFGILITLKNASAYVIHNPITIYGNADFTSANGVTGGSGTSIDPYIIEGWEIDGSSSISAIEIINTDAYFIIRNVNLHSSLFFGIMCDMCINGIIEDSTIKDNIVGLWLENCSNFDLSNNIVSDNEFGPAVYYCNSVTLTSNQILRNTYTGIYIEATTNAIISNNDIKINYLDGIYAAKSSGIQFSNNNISENGGSGIWLNDSMSSSIVDNTFVDNWLGIDIEYTIDTTVTGNMLFSDGINMWGDTLSHFNSHVISSNYANGKPIYYYKDKANLNINNISVGQLFLANCQNISIENISISNTAIGIMLAFVEKASLMNNIITESECGLDIEFSKEISLMNNEISNNDWDGIYFENSENCVLSHNIISSNGPTGIISYLSENFVIYENMISMNDIGIDLQSSLNFTVYKNNFIDNAVQALDDSGSENFWDMGSSVGGNYWSDYIGTDANDDGFGDTPYSIDFDSKDYYPSIGQIDLIPPNTGRALDGTPGQNEWYISPVTVTLSPSDDSSGVNWTRFRINGSDWEEYDEPILISEDGQYIVEYCSADYAENLEEIREIEISIDQTVPYLRFEQDNGTIFNSTSVTFSWIYSDNLSGIVHIEVCLDKGNFTHCGVNTSIDFVNISEGSHNVTIRASDQAGNMAERMLWFEIEFEIDADGGDILGIESLLLITSVIVIVSLILIILAITMKKRKKLKQPPIESNESQITREMK